MLLPSSFINNPAEQIDALVFCSAWHLNTGNDCQDREPGEVLPGQRRSYSVLHFTPYVPLYFTRHQIFCRTD
jgi:hypothetical protein